MNPPFYECQHTSFPTVETTHAGLNYGAVAKLEMQQYGGFYMYKSKIDKLSKQELQNIINESTGYVNALRNIGYSGNSSLYKLKDKINEYDISLEKMKRNRKEAIKQGQNSDKYSLDKILVKDSDYTNISRLKKRLLKNELLNYKCDICGNEGMWNGAELKLQLDHINGDPSDHRLKNLRFLCPNCHSQTDTFAGKNGTYG